MNDARWLELWLRRESSEGLTSDEAQELVECLRNDAVAGALAAADDSLHAQLESFGHTSRSEDAFVASVMSRVAAAALEPDVAAPPLASLVHEPQAPPVVSPPSPPHPASAVVSSRPILRSGFSAWRLFDSAQRPVLATLAAALLLAVGFALGRASREPLPDTASTSSRPDSRSDIAQRPTRTPSRHIARGVPIQATQAVWRTGGPRESQLPPGRHELVDGTVRIALDDDLAAELRGPATVELSEDEALALRQGSLRVSGYFDEQAPLRIATPVSALRRLSGEVELLVDAAGETRIVVHRGSTLVGAQNPLAVTDYSARIEPISLVHGGFDHARLFAPLEASERAPQVVELSGPEQRFLGRIVVDGAPLDFSSPEVFTSTRNHVEQHFRRSPQEFQRLWTQLVQTVGAADDAPATIVVNGHADAAASTDELVATLQAQATHVSASASTQDGTGETFHAVLVVNGKKRTFRSRAEFEAAQRELLAPWRRLQEMP